MVNTSFLQEIQKPKVFEAFINAGMRDSSYVAEWKKEMGTPQYCAAKAYQAYLAEYSAAMAGSVVDKNAERPTHQLPAAAEMVGSISRMSDEWQLDNDKLSQFYYMEQRLNDSLSRNYLGVSSEQQRADLVNYLFGMFEKAVIAPHKRIDMLYFEGLYQGTQSVTSTNNSKSGLAFSYDLGVTKFKALTEVWGNADATPITDMMQVCNYAESKGRTVLKVRMSRSTYQKMFASKQVQSEFTAKNTRYDSKINGTVVPLESMNAYLESIMLPPIEVESPKYVTLANGTSTSLVPNDRVVFQCADRIAELKVSDPLEAIDQIPNKTYSMYDGNLVGFWRNDKGRFVDYEMWGTPVFTGLNNYFILKTDEK